MAEQYANNISTTLNGGLDDTTTTVVVTSATGMPATGVFRIRVDDELMRVTSRSSTTLTVARGAESTTAAAHSSGAVVTVVLTAAGLLALPTAAKTIGCVVDGGGAAVTAGVKGYVRCPISGTITAWAVMADLSGNVEFDVYKDAPGSTYPPTTSIVASAPPELSGADFDDDTTLSGWTTTVTAGDVFGFEIVGSPTTMTRVTLQLTVTP